VNNHHLTGMTSEEATGLLRELTKKPGPICLKVIKMEPSPQSTRSSNIGVPMLPNSYYNQPLMLQSIASPDLNARVAPWVAYTEAMRSTASIAPTSLYSEDLQHPRYSLEDVGQRAPLSLDTNILTVVRRMAARDSGLEVKNRMWLKIEIKNAFMGRNLVK
jgi:segment polarity protein dishevelled